MSARTSLMTTLTGWLAADACSHPGVVATGTKAELAKMSGSTGSVLAICAVSGP